MPRRKSPEHRAGGGPLDVYLEVDHRALDVCLRSLDAHVHTVLAPVSGAPVAERALGADGGACTVVIGELDVPARGSGIAAQHHGRVADRVFARAFDDRAVRRRTQTPRPHFLQLVRAALPWSSLRNATSVQSPVDMTAKRPPYDARSPARAWEPATGTAVRIGPDPSDSKSADGSLCATRKLTDPIEPASSAPSPPIACCRLPESSMRSPDGSTTVVESESSSSG